MGTVWKNTWNQLQYNSRYSFFKYNKINLLGFLLRIWSPKIIYDLGFWFIKSACYVPDCLGTKNVKMNKALSSWNLSTN